MASQSPAGTDRSASALGLGYKQWTRNDLGLILSHYGVPFAAGDSNTMLIGSLNQLAAQRGLTREDRLAIINAHKAGLHLPPRKPPVQASIAPPAILQAVVNPPSILQPEEYSSGTSEGSDVDMSDGEDTEEIPSLSDEERGLREDTAHMNLPRNNENCRTLRPRVTDHVSSTQVATRTYTRETSHAVNAECIICYNSLDQVKTLVRQPTSSCRHEANVCKPCVSASITSQLDTKVWTRIDCPISGCDELLEYGDIQAFADPQIFARYFEFTFQAAQADSNFQRCRTPGCNSGQQCFPEDTIMHCRECRHSTCITCDTEMHHGVSCAEKSAERQTTQQSGELATTKYLEKRAKKCPGCSAPTVKTGGCDHIRCKSCRHEYCWLCLADYGPINEEGNEHHAPDCEHHSDNL